MIIVSFLRGKIITTAWCSTVWIFRELFGIKWHDKVSSVEVRKRTELAKLEQIIKKRIWLRHVIRLDDCRIPKQALNWNFSSTNRSWKNWQDIIPNGFEVHGIDLEWSRWVVALTKQLELMCGPVCVPTRDELRSLVLMQQLCTLYTHRCRQFLSLCWMGCKTSICQLVLVIFEFLASLIFCLQCLDTSVLWRCWLGGRKDICPVKKLSGEVLAWLCVKFRLVLPFWYRLTRVVPDKGPLNVCVCVCVCVFVDIVDWNVWSID